MALIVAALGGVYAPCAGARAQSFECTPGGSKSVLVEAGRLPAADSVARGVELVRLALEASRPSLRYQVTGSDVEGEFVWSSATAVGGRDESMLVREGESPRLMLRCDSDQPAGGAVQLIVRERRLASARDRISVRARRLVRAADAERMAYEPKAVARALASYSVATDLWLQLGELREAGIAGERVGSMLQQSGHYAAAAAHYRAAARWSEEAGDSRLQSTVRGALGLALVLLGDHEEGRLQCQRALELSAVEDSAGARAKALGCIGEIAYQQGALPDALDAYGEAFELWRVEGDSKGQALAAHLLGVTYSDLGEFDLALAHQRDALALWQETGDRRGELTSLVALGQALGRVGDHQSALNALGGAMELAETIGEPLRRARVLSVTAKVYESMGDDENAGPRWSRALGLYREAGVRLAVADMLLFVGRQELIAGDPKAARESFRESLALGQDLDNEIIEAYALRSMGLTFKAEGELQKALELYSRGLSRIGRQDKAFEALALNDLANAYLELGELSSAKDHYQQSIERSREGRNPVSEVMGLHGLARVTSSLQELHQAREWIEEALRVAESVRSEVASPELRASCVASIHDLYALRVELLMRMHQQDPSDGLDEAALAASERARARSLLESLAEAQLDIRGGSDPGLLDRERRLKRTLDGKTERLMRVTSSGAVEEAAALEREISELGSQYELVRAEIRSESPRYAALAEPEPLDLEGIQQQVLDGESLLLAYALGEERSFLWTASKESLSSYVLPPREEIEAAARELYSLLTARLPVPDDSVADRRRRTKEADVGYWRAASELSETLLGPAAEEMAGKRLLVVTDGALQYLPFAALPAPRQQGEIEVPLIVEHEIVHLPSASALAVLRRQARERDSFGLSVAVLADPVFEADDARLGEKAKSKSATATTSLEMQQALREPPAGSSTTLRALRAVGFVEGDVLRIPRLAATRREAEAIAAAAPTGSSLTVMDFDANLAAAKDPELGRYPIIHFATHGLVNSENPALSGILLSMVDENGEPQPGFLRLDDIYNLELPVELVVLSACSTALGKEIRGEGLVGIVRGFFYAGAKRVIASLWKVDDDATGQLMGRFYRHLLEGELSPAAALRQAQIEMWQEGDLRQPFYWAAFVLQGEYR